MPEGVELPDATEPKEGTPAQITLTHARVACMIHGEVFRAKWPVGFPLFSVLVVKAALNRDDVWSTMKRIGGVVDGPVPVTAIEAVLDMKPACCHVSKETLVQCYKDCGIGVDGRCNVCHRKRLGTSYRTRDREYTHLCFECVSGAFGAH